VREKGACIGWPRSSRADQAILVQQPSLQSRLQPSGIRVYFVPLHPSCEAPPRPPPPAGPGGRAQAAGHPGAAAEPVGGHRTHMMRASVPPLHPAGPGGRAQAAGHPGAAAEPVGGHRTHMMRASVPPLHPAGPGGRAQAAGHPGAAAEPVGGRGGAAPRQRDAAAGEQHARRGARERGGGAGHGHRG